MGHPPAGARAGDRTVTWVDHDTGETGTIKLTGDNWALVCSGRLSCDGFVTHANGTVQITAKIDKD